MSVLRPSQPIRLIACDMDGTLLNEDFRLSAETKTAVRRAVEQGIHFVLVSGRMLATLLPFHRELGLTTPVIGYNGAYIWDVAHRTVLGHMPIPYEIAQEVLDRTEPAGLHVQYFWDDRFWARERTPWMELYESRTRLEGHLLPSLREFGPDRLPTKMQIITTPEEVQRLIREFRDHFGPRLYVTNTLPEYVELMHPEVSKGRALQVVAHRLGVPHEERMVFGDAQNDETMFEAARYSVAMGNARPSVQRKALLIAPSNVEHGVAAALEAFVLR